MGFCCECEEDACCGCYDDDVFCDVASVDVCCVVVREEGEEDCEGGGRLVWGGCLCSVCWLCCVNSECWVVVDCEVSCDVSCSSVLGDCVCEEGAFHCRESPDSDDDGECDCLCDGSVEGVGSFGEGCCCDCDVECCEGEDAPPAGVSGVLCFAGFWAGSGEEGGGLPGEVGDFFVNGWRSEEEGEGEGCCLCCREGGVHGGG